MGHGCVLVAMDGVVLLTDPLLRRRVAHLRRAAAPVGELPAPDAVLVSHQHGDHLDPASLRRFGTDVRLVAPPGAADYLGRRGFGNVTELAAGRARRGRRRDGARDLRRPRRLAYARQRPASRSASCSRARGASTSPATPTSSPRWPTSGPSTCALLPIWGWGPTLGPGHLNPESAAVAASAAARARRRADPLGHVRAVAPVSCVAPGVPRRGAGPLLGRARTRPRPTSTCACSRPASRRRSTEARRAAARSAADARRSSAVFSSSWPAPLSSDSRLSRRARSMNVDVITAVTIVRNAIPCSITTAPTIRPIVFFGDDVAVADRRHRLQRPPQAHPDARRTRSGRRSASPGRWRRTVQSVVTTITLPAPRIVGGLRSVRVTVRSKTFGGIRPWRSARGLRFLDRGADPASGILPGCRSTSPSRTSPTC